MKRRPAVLAAFAAVSLLALLVLGGCAALQQIAALRTVSFAFANVSDVRFVGIPIDEGTTFSKLGIVEVGKVTAAVIAKKAPLELVAHVNATNPPDNTVSARMVKMGWKFFVNDAQALAGDIGQPVVIAPGATADVPVSVRVDLYSISNGTAREMVDLAVAIAGKGPIRQELKLELTPTIDTAIGPITYPSPVVIRRTATR